MIKCDANKLPEEIKEKAKDYCTNELEHSYADTREELEEDVMRAWLNGFAFCMEGTLTVKVKQCATCVYTDSPCVPSDYAKDNENVCNHYKNVFDAYTELKVDYEVLSCSVGDFGELQGKLEEEQRKNNGLSDNLTKAKEIIKGLLPMASNFVFGTLPKLNEEVQLYRQAEQFLKE